ncbi:hypothetical protein ACF0H5_012996 [Mactra antiquata]
MSYDTHDMNADNHSRTPVLNYLSKGLSSCSKSYNLHFVREETVPDGLNPSNPDILPILNRRKLPKTSFLDQQIQIGDGPKTLIHKKQDPSNSYGSEGSGRSNGGLSPMKSVCSGMISGVEVLTDSSDSSNTLDKKRYSMYKARCQLAAIDY